jgi:peptidoglycan/LPS O-acetylase OafA/YrhL
VFLTSFHLSVDSCERLPILHLSTFALGILLARWQSLRAAQSQVTAQTNAIQMRLIFGLCVLAFAVLVGFSPRSPVIEECLCDGLLAPIFAGTIWVFSDASSHQDEF